MSPRTGRPPIESPLKHDIKVRVNDDVYDELLKYCEKSGKEKATVIREALIDFLRKQPKEITLVVKEEKAVEGKTFILKKN